MRPTLLLLFLSSLLACGQSSSEPTEPPSETGADEFGQQEPVTPELNFEELLAGMPEEPLPEEPEPLVRATTDAAEAKAPPPPPEQETPTPAAEAPASAPLEATPAEASPEPVPQTPTATATATEAGADEAANHDLKTPATSPVKPVAAEAVDRVPMSVASAAVAKAVQDRQPVGSGPYPDGSQVWCWSRIDNPGAQRRRIRHLWYHGTERKAAVGLDIKSTSWRTWSRIPAHGTGDWRVDIVDEDGRVMKSLPFRVE